MKTKKLIQICSLGAIVILIVMILTGMIKLSFHISEVSNSISSRWDNSKSIGQFNGSNNEISFSALPIIVVFKSKVVGDINSTNPVKIDISDKDFGPLWVPLFKKSRFNFTITCKDKKEIKTSSAIGQLNINGEINISGHYKFIGFYSSETATTIIVDKVMNDIYADVKRNMNSIPQTVADTIAYGGEDSAGDIDMYKERVEFEVLNK